MRKLWSAMALGLGAVLLIKLRRSRSANSGAEMDRSAEQRNAEHVYAESEPELEEHTPAEMPPAPQLDNVIEATPSRRGSAIPPRESHSEGTPPGLRSPELRERRSPESVKRRLDDERWRELRAEARARAPMGEPLPEESSSDLFATRLNQVSRQQLLAIYGIGPEVADRIIAGRPYRGGRQLLERNAVNQAQYENLKRRLVQADELLSA